MSGWWLSWLAVAGVGLLKPLLPFSSFLHFPFRVGLEEVEEKPRSPHKWPSRDVAHPTQLVFCAPRVNTELAVQAGIPMLASVELLVVHSTPSCTLIMLVLGIRLGH